MQYLQPNTTLQGGKYRIERVLGKGGFGITYLATQTSLNRQVAIKEFFIENLCDRSVSESTIMRTISNSSASMVDRYKQKFLKEARIISELHHENIINVYDVFEENGTAYYVMEYIDGGSLGSLLQQKGKLTEGEAVDYIKKIANAVEYIHQRQINHFDIKPDNIMLRRDGTPVLIDFGVSKRYDSRGAATTTTPVGISEGYAPIEQYSADGVASFSPQTDIYSLGASLYKLIIGQTPPSAPARSGGTIFNIPTTLRQSTRDAINGAMKLNKDERIVTAMQFVDILRGTKDTKGSAKLKYITIALIIIVMLIVGYYFYNINMINIPVSDAAPAAAANKHMTKDSVCVITAFNNKGEKINVIYTYTGEVEHNLPNGMGTGSYEGSGVYTGHYKDGLREDNNSRMQMINGDVYEGSFKNDFFNGEGTYKTKELLFKGVFKDGNPYNGIWYDINTQIERIKIVDGLTKK